MGEFIEADFFGDEVVGQDIAAPDGFEGFADEAGGVVKRGDDLDFGVVDFGRLDFDECACREAAEEIDDAACRARSTPIYCAR